MSFVSSTGPKSTVLSNKETTEMAAQNFADALQALVAHRDTLFLTRIAEDYKLDFEELKVKYTETCSGAFKVPKKRQAKVTKVAEPGAAPTAAKCCATTAKKEQCKCSCQAGEVFCKRHLKQSLEETAPKAPKEPKAAAPTPAASAPAVCGLRGGGGALPPRAAAGRAAVTGARESVTDGPARMPSSLFPADRLFLIAGPCQLEDDTLNLRVAETLARLAEHVPGGIIFKASFDKANRSNIDGVRGPGLEAGLAALERVRVATGLPILTDVHEASQCALAAEVVDVLQIPAFLCRQTDLLLAAGATGKAVNVKKGQWMHPEGMRGAVRKVEAGATLAAVESGELAVTERGTFFGYGDLVVDMRSFARLRESCDVPVIFDATHSVQRPGQGADGTSGGARECIPPLTLAAVAAGAQGLFIETHPDPDHAPSDGANMWRLDQMTDLLVRVVDIWDRVRS